MSRTISSSLTFIYKVIFPVFWILGFGIGAISTFAVEELESAKWAYLMFWVLGSVFLVWFSYPLKRIEIEGSNLVISNFLKSIKVPAANITKVSENFLINVRPVTIHLNESTPFGRKLTFIPSLHFNIFTSHPVVAEIRELAKKNPR